MKITKPITIGLGVVVVAAGVWLGVAANTPKTADTQAPQPTTGQAQKAQPADITYDGAEGKTALALLQEQESVETKDSSYGTYVDSINGLKGGTDGKYWTFYVNGQMSQVGADAYTTKSGDSIEWKFQ